MIISTLNQEPIVEAKNLKDGEGTILIQSYEDDKHKVMRATLRPGVTIGYHTHEVGSEVMYILEGTANLLCNEKEYELKPGMSHYLPTGEYHSLRNYSTEDLVIFAVITKY